MPHLQQQCCFENEKKNISLANMAKRTPLTTEEKEDARRLMQLFEARQSVQPHLTQLDVAMALGWNTQSAVSQFMNGIIPLKLESAIKFAEYFGCDLKDISPRLAKLLEDLYRRSKSASKKPVKRDTAPVLKIVSNGARFVTEQKPVAKKTKTLEKSSGEFINESKEKNKSSKRHLSEKGNNKKK